MGGVIKEGFTQLGGDGVTDTKEDVATSMSSPPVHSSSSSNSLSSTSSSSSSTRRIKTKLLGSPNYLELPNASRRLMVSPFASPTTSPLGFQELTIPIPSSLPSSVSSSKAPSPKGSPRFTSPDFPLYRGLKGKKRGELSGQPSPIRNLLKTVGMLPRHIANLSSFGEANDSLMIFCSIPPAVAGKLALKDGQDPLHEGKPMRVKGKSIKSGPFKGEVASNQKYSKIAEEIADKTTRDHEIAHYQEFNTKLLSEDFEEANKTEDAIAVYNAILKINLTARIQKVQTSSGEDAKLDDKVNSRITKKMNEEITKKEKSTVTTELDCEDGSRKIYTFKNAKNEQLYELVNINGEERKRVTYAVEYSDGWKKFNYQKNQFDQPIFLPEGYSPAPLEDLLTFFDKKNEKKLAIEVTKTVDHGNEKIAVMTFEDKGGEPLHDDKRRPIYAVQYPEGWKEYNHETDKFDKEFDPKQHQSYTAKEFKAMGIKRVRLDVEKMEIMDKNVTFVSDYDGLASAIRKRPPLRENAVIQIEGGRSLSREEFIRRSKLNDQQAFDDTVDIIFAHQWQLAMERNDRTDEPGFGRVNKAELAAKAWQSYYTENAVGHGDEVDNENPRKWANGDFLVFVPVEPKEINPDSVKVGIKNEEQKAENYTFLVLKSEADVLSFINEWRHKGFPLRVNAQWGWQVDEETGDLYKPNPDEPVFDWEKVREGLESIEAELQTVTSKLKKDGTTPADAVRQQLEEQKGYLEQRIADEKAIFRLRIQLESLRLEPQIIYGAKRGGLSACVASWYERGSEGLDEPAVEQYWQKVAEAVRQKEIVARNELIAKKEQELVRACDNFKVTHGEDKPCIIELVNIEYVTKLQAIVEAQQFEVDASSAQQGASDAQQPLMHKPRKEVESEGERPSIWCCCCPR